MKSYAKGRAGPFRRVDRRRLYPAHRQVVEALVERSTVLVCNFADVPQEQLGFVVFEPEVLHYVYVKRDHRRCSVGTALVREAHRRVGLRWASHDTWQWRRLNEQLQPQLEYSPGHAFYPPVAQCG
jgi:GNAT superfamily N-acetyltransferase